jgi:hypothetical protein
MADWSERVEKYGGIAAIAFGIIILIYVFMNMESKLSITPTGPVCSNGGKLVSVQGESKCLTRMQALGENFSTNGNNLIFLALIIIIIYLMYRQSKKAEMATFQETIDAAFVKGEFWTFYHMTKKQFNFDAAFPNMAYPCWIVTGFFDLRNPSKEYSIYLNGIKGDRLFGHIMNTADHKLPWAEIKKERDKETDIGKFMANAKKAKEILGELRDETEEG